MKYDLFLRLATAAAVMALAACSSVPLDEPAPPAAPSRPGQPGAAAPDARPAVPAAPRTSQATNARAYRLDAASHIYERNAGRIWKGKLPSMLYAIGVLEVDLDGRGHVRRLNWRRAPRHAPEVIAEIEHMVREAQPFPVPERMRRGVTYTDVWLWDASGRFQLDTLTEGQE